jgi:hypothetical protein
MCHFGGPDGMYAKHDPGPVPVHHYGNGVYWGEAMPARTHLALSRADPDIVYLIGEGGPGDSGSGIIDLNGEAVGVLVAGLDCRGVYQATGLQTCSEGAPWLSSLIIVTRLDVQLKRAEKVLKTKFNILSASINTDVL